MAVFNFSFTISGINKRQAAMIMRTIVRLVEVFNQKPTITEPVDLGGGFEEVKPEEKEPANVQ